jgi:hypothetical protein
MGTTLTLDDIQGAAEARFGTLDIPLANGKVLQLVNPLRLPKEARAELTTALAAGKKADGAKPEDADVDESFGTLAELYQKVIRIAALDDASGADQLLKALVLPSGEPDLAKLMVVVEKYMESQKVGEA